MMKNLLAAIALLFTLTVEVQAQAYTYPYKPASGPNINIMAGQVAGNVLPYAAMVDTSGAAFGTTANPIAIQFGTGVTLPNFAAPQHVICDSGCSGGGGGAGAVYGPTAVGSAVANPPVMVGGSIDGTATGAVSIWKVANGVGFINCANCSGSGISVAFAGSIGTVGTPNGYKDASGNFQPILGDVTNGQWVSVKASVPISLTGTLPAFAATPTVNIGTAPTIAVTGTFWQATQPVSASSLPLPTGAATAANQIAVQGSATGGTAGTSSQLAGAIYNSVAPTLTNGQQAGLQLDSAGNLKVNVVTGGGAGGGTSSSFGSAFPATGTAAGMSQGGNMVALTGTSGNLNVQCANCSGSGASATDQAAFTAGASVFAPTGGVFNDGLSNLTSGQQAMVRMTNDRQLKVQDSALLAAVQGPIAAGTAVIGKVGIDQTTPGTTNAVQATNLPATVATSSGNLSASTLRVVIATDQPTNTNPLSVSSTPSYGSALLLTANINNAGASGDQTIVAAPGGGSTIKVYYYKISCAAAQATMTWKDGASAFAGGVITGAQFAMDPLVAEPYYTTSSTSNALVLNFGTASTCTGMVKYKVS